MIALLDKALAWVGLSRIPRATELTVFEQYDAYLAKIGAAAPDALNEEKRCNAILFSALYELVDAIENDSGAEPSKSVYDRALDAAKELACYRPSLQDSEV